MPRGPVLLTLVLVAVAGCGGGDASPKAKPRPAASTATTPAPRPAAKKKTPPPPRAACPPSTAGCVVATGRVVYVEKVDPDGDGDAHFVVFGGHVTGPGMSVIDLPVNLRPHPLPGVGDTISAAGPVAVGSHGQRQVEVQDFRFRRR
jgi:hypothetical protein